MMLVQIQVQIQVQINKIVPLSSIYYLDQKLFVNCVSNVDRLLLLFTGFPKSHHRELDMVVVPPGSKDVIKESKTGVMPNSN